MTFKYDIISYGLFVIQYHLPSRHFASFATLAVCSAMAAHGPAADALWQDSHWRRGPQELQQLREEKQQWKLEKKNLLATVASLTQELEEYKTELHDATELLEGRMNRLIKEKDEKAALLAEVKVLRERLHAHGLLEPFAA